MKRFFAFATLAIALAASVAPAVASNPAAGGDSGGGRDLAAIECLKRYPADYQPAEKTWGIFWTHPCVDWANGIVALAIRLVGIFVLLGVVQVGMQVASFVIMRTENGRAKREAAGKPASKPGAGAKPAAPKAPESGVPGEVVAAIAAALEMESSVGVIPDEVLASGATTSWSYAGRAASMNARVTVTRAIEKPQG